MVWQLCLFSSGSNSYQILLWNLNQIEKDAQSMQQHFIRKLHQYLFDNNIDLLVTLQGENKVSVYLQDKVDTVAPSMEELLAENTPPYIIEERCMDELTKDLRPSRFHYITSILAEEFETEYYRLKESRVFIYEVINVIGACNEVFESIGFTVDNEDDKPLRYAIINAIRQYLESGERENVKYGVQSVTEVK
jgi:hypothetical protein